MHLSSLVPGCVVLALGCASGPRAAPEVEAPRATGQRPPLRYVEGAFGEEHSKRADELVVPFGVNQNGTELVLVAAQRAEEAGAAFLGDIHIVMTFKWGGTPVECTSRVVFDDDPALQKKAAVASVGQDTAYGTNVEDYQPKLVPFHAEEQELFCTEHERVVARDVPTRHDRHDVDEGRMKERSGFPGSDKELVRHKVHECEKRPVVRDTTRYDHEIKLGFVPPNWDYLSARFGAGRKILQTPPVCYSLDEAELAKKPGYRLVAKAFHQGPYRLDTPGKAPSADDMEGYDRTTFEDLVAHCVESLGGPEAPRKSTSGDRRAFLTPQEYCEMKLRQHRRGRPGWGDKVWEQD